MGKTTEQIDKECRKDLKEIAEFYGGWDELRKMIAILEENEQEAAFERFYSGGPNAWSAGFADNH